MCFAFLSNTRIQINVRWEVGTMVVAGIGLISLLSRGSQYAPVRTFEASLRLKYDKFDRIAKWIVPLIADHRL